VGVCGVKHRFAALSISMLLSAATHAEDVKIIPSLELSQMSDDNLNYSPFQPVSDRIRRVTPSLALHLDSPRWSVRSSYGLDNERYEDHPLMNSARARQRAALTIHYISTPRLTLSIDGDYLNTNSLADLNADTGLAASRVRGSRMAITPSAHFRISPTAALVASVSATTTNVLAQSRTRSQFESLGIERRTTPRDTFSIDLE